LHFSMIHVQVLHASYCLRSYMCVNCQSYMTMLWMLWSNMYMLAGEMLHATTFTRT
jgi:hypothetical protein